MKLERDVTYIATREKDFDINLVNVLPQCSTFLLFSRTNVFVLNCIELYSLASIVWLLQGIVDSRKFNPFDYMKCVIKYITRSQELVAHLSFLRCTLCCIATPGRA